MNDNLFKQNIRILNIIRGEKYEGFKRSEKSRR